MDKKKLRRRIAALLVGAACSVAVFGMVGCNNDKPDDGGTGKPPVTEVEKFTVTFDANGGTLTGNSTVSVEDGGKITSAPTASKKGFTFSGWFTAKEGGTEVNLSTYEVTAAVTLYAHYTEDEEKPEPVQGVKVTFDANGGTLTGEATVTIDKDSFVATDKIPAAAYEGYIFKGWFTAKDGGNEVIPDFDSFSADTTLYAHWAKAYTVTFDAGEGDLSGDATVIVEENGRITKIPTASLSGLEFHGWYTAEEGGELVDLETYKVTGDVTLYARYGQITMPLKNLKDSEGAAVGYRIEAEEAKIQGTLSSENASGTGFIENNQATASGGSSVGYFGVAGNTITFTFMADKAGKATISLRASSNNTQMDFSQGFLMWVDDQVVSEKDISFNFNGTKVSYEAQTLRGAGKDMPMTWNYYWDPISLGELDVKEGLNSVVVTAMGTAVPNIDCLDIETSLTLTSANGEAASGEAQLPAPPAPEVVYEGDVTVDLIVGAYAGGPAIEKAVLDFGSAKIAASSLAENPLSVSVAGAKLGGNGDKVYLCDKDGNELKDATESQYVAIQYAVSYGQWSFNGNLSPFSYNNMNTWKDLTKTTVAINGTLTVGDTDYTKMGDNVTFGERIIPSLENWTTNGTFTKDDITLTYGYFATEAMKNDGQKNPLIIWLHGAGEGGVDPTINILGNQVTNLSKDMIQKYFTTDTVKGAYVLAPQTPTAWMDKDGSGTYGTEEASQYYVAALKGLIDSYIAENGDIDMNRIYIGGCSNGGFMTVNMILNFPDFFAAAFPICEAYNGAWLTEEAIESIKDMPIWFTHSANDNTVNIADVQYNWMTGQTTVGDLKDAYTNNLYIELINAGATNVHYTLFETVNVEGVNYDGHWSWIYTLRDECVNVQPTEGADGADLTLGDLDPASTEKVTIDGEEVTLWGWLAAQVKAGE